MVSHSYAAVAFMKKMEEERGRGRERGCQNFRLRSALMIRNGSLHYFLKTIRKYYYALAVRFLKGQFETKKKLRI